MNRRAGSLREAAPCAVIKTVAVFQKFFFAMGSGTAGMDQTKLTVVSQHPYLNYATLEICAAEFHLCARSSGDAGRVVSTGVQQCDS